MIFEFCVVSRFGCFSDYFHSVSSFMKDCFCFKYCELRDQLEISIVCFLEK